MIFFLFFIWKAVDFIIISLALKTIPFLGSFAYQKDLAFYQLPRYISSLANFDGLYYLRIARFGYQQFEQVFFPLYPFIIRFLMSIFSNPLIAGLIISNFSFLLGLIFFKKYLVAIKQWSNETMLFLLFFPTSFFFGAVYTESLFFLLVVLTFYLLKKEKIFLAGVFAFFAALTRLVGVFLFIPFLITLLFTKKSLRSTIYHLSSILLPFLGLSLYMYYLYISTGDSLAFFHSQTVFGPARSNNLILLPQVYFRYLKIFLTAQPNFQYFVSFFEFFIFSFVFIVLILDLIKNCLSLEVRLVPRNPTRSSKSKGLSEKDKMGRTKWKKLKIKNYSLLSLNLFSLSNILLPTLTGSFMSIPRFALLSLSFFIFLGRIKSIWLTNGLLVIFAVFHLIILGLFIQGYFVS